MPKSLLRVPFTGALPPPVIRPKGAHTTSGAVDALVRFLTASDSTQTRAPYAKSGTVLLTGAGISVASGLADYRGAKGTYTLNKTYRPIYFNEFVESHEARKRYWARSFLGWTNLHRSRPNAAHLAVRDLGARGLVRSVITQNVDSFHLQAHPELPTLELHGYLRSTICLSCRNEYARDSFQAQLATLNPEWAAFLEEALASGALSTEHPDERRRRGLKTNPDGDVDLPNAPYSTFRYPSCPTCLENPPQLAGTTQRTRVHVDPEGAWLPTSNAGVLKPAVVMFGESISADIKDVVNQAIDEADRILVLGSSLATYSAWRLVKRAKDSGMPIGIVNMGGVRGEDTFFQGIPGSDHDGDKGVRIEAGTEDILPKIAEVVGDVQRKFIQ